MKPYNLIKILNNTNHQGQWNVLLIILNIEILNKYQTGLEMILWVHHRHSSEMTNSDGFIL